MGRSVLLRLERGQPLTAFSPLWAGLAGLLASGALDWTTHTLVTSILLLLLVEPLMGGLWDLALTPTPAPEPDAAEADKNGSADEAGFALPYIQPASAAHRLLSALSAGAGSRVGGSPLVAFAISLALALAVASLLGLALPFLLAALIVLLLRKHWQTGAVALGLGAAYSFLLPWLMGMAALGQMSAGGLLLYRPVLLLALLSTVAYAACLALTSGSRLPALLVLDATQIVVFGLLIMRQEYAALWLAGAGLIGQMAAHPAFLAGGSGGSYVRRAALYLALAILVAAVALAPSLAGV